MQELTDDQRYAAIAARDARFDGMFFVCVRSTGIFCRPSCPSRTPRRESVEFVPSAPAAVSRGYRACKRCGPVAPPGTVDADPGAALAARALQLISEGALDASSVWAEEQDGRRGEETAENTVPGLAARLQVTERTLHRALVAHTGAGALAHARMIRARRAHELLRTTDRPVSEVAAAAGFGSEQQLRDALARVFDRTPTMLRRATVSRSSAAITSSRSSGAADPTSATGTPDAIGTPGTTDPTGGPAAPEDGRGGDPALVRAELAVRRPFHGEGLATWFAHRAVPGVEQVDGTIWTRAVQLRHGPGVLEVDLGAPGALPLTVRLADLRDYPAAVALTRRLLDLDADPVGIDHHLAAAVPQLAPLVAQRPGVRIPGTVSIAEALMWAIVGQQITTAQARDQITRATDLAGQALPEGLRTGSVTRLPVLPADAARTADAWFRGPGARRRALVTALSADIDPHQPNDALRTRLLALPGVGPWTADYVLLRAARATDSFPARDVALLGAARDLQLADDHDSLTLALQPASPWRSYASLHLWLHNSTLTPPPRRRRSAAPPVKDAP